MTKSLLARQSPLAVVEEQLRVLQPGGDFEPFHERIARDGLAPLTATGVRVFQVNLGRMCNMTCRHCHVDAGPDRKEIMTRETMRQCLEALDRSGAEVVDLTGGAPEMNPHFRWLVGELHARGRHVIDRCNLTILLLRAYDGLAEFLAGHDVEVVASLPYYTAGNTDRQRGDGVFDKSVRALRKLNALGYGHGDPRRRLSLVYNPNGAFLPPPQEQIAADFRGRLAADFGIAFDDLYAIANQPINRFLDYLLESGNYAGYMARLLAAYNPAAAAGVMCRDTVSIDWRGFLYDCDFNQMLALPTHGDRPKHVADWDGSLASREIVTGLHCYACTAGQGSSCGGAVA